jgi:hypothetical protein
MSEKPIGERRRRAEAIDCSWLKRSEPRMGGSNPNPRAGRKRMAWEK